MQEQVGQLLRERKGHFIFESGHHGETWLELETLCWRPERVRPIAAALAERIGAYAPGAICGPLNEGAFLALLVALDLGLTFTYSSPDAASAPVSYRIPRLLAARLGGLKVAIIDDVINAGSAVGGTIAALKQAGAVPVVIGAMAVYGDSANELARANGLALEALLTRPSRIWEPDHCPLCARGVPVDGCCFDVARTGLDEP